MRKIKNSAFEHNIIIEKSRVLFSIENNQKAIEVCNKLINKFSNNLEILNIVASMLLRSGKTINAGIATSRFSSKENNPKKIVAQCFSPIATYIAAKFSAIVEPKSIPSKN